MNTYTRRSVLALSGISAFAVLRADAYPQRIRIPGRPLYSCSTAVGTPEIIRVESDIPFDRAYIDTTIPYHFSAITLADLAGDDLEDDRLIEISTAILEDHPKEIEKLRGFRQEWFNHPEPDDATHEMMLLAMGGLESCTDQSHMDFMDSEWVKKTWSDNDDHLLAFVSMLVLVLEMEQHQHTVGAQLADHSELTAFCERMIEIKTPQIKTLKEVRGELISRY